MFSFPRPSGTRATLFIPLDEPLAWTLVGILVAPRDEAADLLDSTLARSSELGAWALLREFDRSGRLLESIDVLRDAILAAGPADFLLVDRRAYENATSRDERTLHARLDAALPTELRGQEKIDPRRAFDRTVLTAPVWASCGDAIVLEPRADGGELPWTALPLPAGWRRLWRRAALRHGLDEQALAKATIDAAREAVAAGRSPRRGGGPPSTGDEASLAHRTLERTARLVLEREAGEVEFRRRLDVERWASMKELAYGASHEINNPLANIASRAQVLAESERDADRRTKLQAIERQAFRAFTMIQNLMLVADPPIPCIERCDWSALLDRGVARWSGEATSKGLRVERAGSRGSDAWIDADPSQTDLVLDELVRNAVEASSAGGRIRVVGPEPAREDLGAGVRDGWLVEIADEGPGLSPVARERLFDPFYSGREAGRGQGFGLSKARRIVELHGGLLRCRELSPRGLAVQWFLPRGAATAETGS